jgi:hypothetical protein
MIPPHGLLVFYRLNDRRFSQFLQLHQIVDLGVVRLRFVKLLYLKRFVLYLSG